MSAITDGFGPRVVPAGLAPRRGSTFPAPVDRADRTERSVPSRTGDLAPSYEAHGRVWAEAAKTRQLDQTLGRLSDRTGELKVRLERVKLYPPYPLDETPRAAAIREFNGLAEEVRRMNVVMSADGVSVTSLAPNASTAEAERVVSALTQAGAGLDARRAGLAAAAAAPGARGAESRSVEIGSRLGDGTLGGISRHAGDILRQVG